MSSEENNQSLSIQKFNLNQAEASLKNVLLMIDRVGPSREASLVKTKIEEALLWASKINMV